MSGVRIGVVGLGRMGLAICERLLGAGYAITATDLVSDRCGAAAQAGASTLPTATAVAAASDVVITVLPGSAEVAGVAGPLLAGLAPGATWIDMSSADPSTAQVVRAMASARDVHTLDAPVGGGPDEARDGRLLTFVGGESADVDAQRELLSQLADRIVAVGPSGAGYTVKLLVNLLWFGQAVATAEALTLATKAGLDPHAVTSALAQSAAASRFIEHDASALLSGDDMASFSLSRCADQLSAVLALGEQFEVPLDLASAVAAVHDEALARYGDVDGELLGARLVAERAGVTFATGGSEGPNL